MGLEGLGGESVGEGGRCLPSGVVCFSDMVNRLLLDATEFRGSENYGQCVKDVVV